MTTNPKHLLSDFYLALLSLPHNEFRNKYQFLYADVREVLASELGCDPETVRNIFERMAWEDS